jgi:choline dehydrogenase-like flavoprotein
MQSAASIDHADCTWAMGEPTDPNAMVDFCARVIAVKGLHVVDA